MDLDLPRGSASTALLLEHAAELGLDPTDVLTGTDLSPGDVHDPEREVTGRQELQALTTLAGLVDDPVATGLALGARYHVTTYGLWGFALVSSPTLREAIALGLRYLGLTFVLVDLAFVEGAHEARLELSADHLDGRVKELAVARDAAAIATLQADLAPAPDALREVRLAVSAPTGAAAGTTLAGVPVAFGAPSSVAVLDPAALDRPLPRANAHTRAMCEAQCRDLLERRRRRGGIAGQVRDRLLSDPAAMPDMDRVAAERYVTARTLRRQLADEGASFRGLVEEVREALAEELLTAAGLTVEETARRLGYAEPAAFIHAFRRWKDTTPGAWRDTAVTR